MTRRKDYRGVSLRLNLQRFAEGGESSESAQATEQTGESTEQVAAVNTETRKSFDELIKGDYKEDYEKSIKQAIGRRMQGAKANEAKLAKIAPIMQALASKYGIEDPEDIESISKYVEDDDAMYEDAAYEAGMTVDQYKRYARIEAENRRLLAERQENEDRRRATAQYNIWKEEAEKIQAEFPNFNLETYLQDERFQALLRNHVDLRTAYIAMDADNVIPQAMGYAAKETARKTAATISQRGLRPAEGGLSTQASSKAETDVSKLSDAEMADLVRRASQGERIRFS